MGTQIPKKVPMGTRVPKWGPIGEQWGWGSGIVAGGGGGGSRGEYFSLSRDTCPCLIFYFSCSYIQIRVFRAEILVRNSYA